MSKLNFNWQGIDWLRIAKAVGKVFLILLVIYLLFDKILMPAYTRHGQAIVVPNLTNLVYEDAREVLDRLDLKIVEEAKRFDTNNQFPIGVVMSQNPRAGSTVKKGRRVYVIVSKGEPTVEMPNLLGGSERNAIFQIEYLGLNVGAIRYEHSDLNPAAGIVIAQNIPPGREVKLGAAVDLVVSLGRLPDRFIVPNVIGLSLEEASKLIFEAGLSVGEISYQDRSDLLPETVFEQYPQAEIEIRQGESVNLVVSKLPDRY